MGYMWFHRSFHRQRLPNVEHHVPRPTSGQSKAHIAPHGVSLKEWIEKRCAEDFDLVMNRSNQNCIGHAGTLDSEVVAMSRMERQPGSSRHNGQQRKGGKGKGGKGAKR